MESVLAPGGPKDPGQGPLLLFVTAGDPGYMGAPAVLASVRACAREARVEVISGLTDLLERAVAADGSAVLVEIPSGSSAGPHALRLLMEERPGLPLVALVPPGDRESDAALGAGACEVLSAQGLTEATLWGAVGRAGIRALRRAAAGLERALLVAGIAASRMEDLVDDLILAVRRDAGVERAGLYLRVSSSAWRCCEGERAVVPTEARPTAEAIASLMASVRSGGDGRAPGGLRDARLRAGGFLLSHVDEELPPEIPLRDDLDPRREAQTVCVIPVSSQGKEVAALWLADSRPRAISSEAAAALGRVAPALGVAIERLLAAERIRRRRSRGRLLAAALDTLLVELGGEGALVDPEPAWERFTGQGFEQARGQGWIEALHPEDQVPVRGALEIRPSALLARAARLWHAESGGYRHVTLRLLPIPAEGSSEGEWLLAVTDAHEEALVRREREDLEAQLRQAQRMEAVGRLAGGLAHDLNNLLTVIQGNSYLLSALALENPSVAAEVKGIDHAARRAAELTRRLLTFSRRTPCKAEVLDLNVVVSEAASMLRRVIGEDVDLRFHYAEGLPEVKADPGQMEQILMNLLVNARDAMPGGGLVTVETAEVELGESLAQVQLVGKPGLHVMLAVSDTGLGMDKETQAKIFDPFFTTKDAGKGTGLGLSTVYSIVKQNGGHIFVQSAVGEGTTFKVYLPALEEAAGEAGDGAGNRRPRLATVRLGGSETVLVAEDDHSLRKMVERILTGSGYAVLAAGDGEEALARARDHRGEIHLVVTDLVMPRMNGMPLVKALVEARPDCRVLFMSGYADNAVVDRGVLSMHSAFLAKPFTPHQLLSAVRKALDQG